MTPPPPSPKHRAGIPCGSPAAKRMPPSTNLPWGNIARQRLAGRKVFATPSQMDGLHERRNRHDNE